MYCVRVALLTAFAAICSGGIGDLPLVLAEVSDNTTYTKTETAMMEAFNFCTNDEPITWIDKSANSVAGNVNAGAANSDTKPTYGTDGKIVNLASFVEERLKILPDHNDDSINMNPSHPLLNVATLIIENDCAYVEQPSDDCVFDYCKYSIPFYEEICV